jgi:hypothetical protein
MKFTNEYEQYGDFYVSSATLERGSSWEKEEKHIIGCPKCGGIFLE